MTDRELLQSISDIIIGKIGAITDNMATKEDLSNMATKEDNSNMATKQDISNLAHNKNLAQHHLQRILHLVFQINHLIKIGVPMAHRIIQNQNRQHWF